MKPGIPKYYDPVSKLVYETDSCTELKKAWDNKELELTTLVRGTYPGKPLLKGELSGVKSIGYWDIKKLQNWGLDWHTNEGIEICFLGSGNLQFQINDNIYFLEPGTLTITRPWLIHKIGNPNVDLSKLYWLILDVEVRHPHQDWKWPDWIILNKKDLAELTIYLRQNEQPLWKASSEISECFSNLGKTIKSSNEKEYESRLKVLINTLFILLLELFRNGEIILDQSLIESKRTVKLFLETLKSNLDEKWNLEKMADYCLLGSTRFTHYCEEIINCSPIEYLNLLRLNEASKLLTETPDISMTEVAYRCGFSSPQYFNFAFKKHFGISPLAFRKQQIKQY